MKQKLLGLLAIILIENVSICAQSNILKSPQLADMVRFDNTIISKNSGRLDMNIEVLRLEEKDFNIPISLSYNSSGFIPMKTDGFVGLDWSMNTGGVIYREVKGIPDDREIKGTSFGDRKGFLHLVKGSIKYDKEKIVNDPSQFISFISGDAYFTDSKIEYSSDIYYFSFGNYSGKFVIDYDGTVKVISNGEGTFKVDLSDYVFDKTSKSSTIKIIADNGYCYWFGGSVDNTEYSVSWTDYSGLSSEDVYKSAFYLSKIVAPNGNSLEISYYPVDDYFHRYPYYILTEDYNFRTKPFRQNYILSVINQSDFVQNPLPPSGGSKINSWIYTLTKIALIKEIKTNLQSVTFYYSPKEKSLFDISRDPLTSFPANCGAKLDSICLSSTAGSRIKSGYFSYSYNGGTYSRMFLKEVNIPQTGKYTFDYNNTGILPGPLTQNIDYWNYWRGTPESASGIPAMTIDKNFDLIYTGNNREPGNNEFDKCLLNKITYPTGGSTEITYEQHKYSKMIDRKAASEFSPSIMDLGMNKKAGGVRVKKIINNSLNGKETKVYEYCISKDDTISSGILNNYPRYYDEIRYSVVYSGGKPVFSKLPTPKITYSNTGFNKSTYEKDHVLYSNVIETIPESESIDPVSKVEKYYGPYTVSTFSDHQTNPDKTSDDKVLGTLPPDDKNYTMYIQNYKREVQDCSKERGKLIKEEYFDNQKKMVKTVEYKYSNDNNRFNDYSLYFNLYYLTVSQANKIYFYPYNLIKKETKTYNQNNSTYIHEIIDYSYNSINRVNSVTALNSDNFAFKTAYSYPSDFSLISPYKEMIPKNILSPIVEKSIYYNDVLQEKESRDYKLYNSTFYAPCNLKSQTKTGNLEIREEYKYNSKGNIQEIIKDNADKVVYLWSYNYQYPIAEIKGATYDEVKAALGYSDTQIESLAAQVSPDVNGATIGSKLRSYFLNKPALVTTYTYKPLVGLESVTDPKGVTTTYQYDAFGRLNKTSHNGQTINTYEYHYKAN